jgi:hypothetical protein
MTLTITGIVYLDGCMPFVGTAIDESGMRLDVVFNETPSGQQRVALLDTIEATGDMVHLRTTAGDLPLRLRACRPSGRARSGACGDGSRRRDGDMTVTIEAHMPNCVVCGGLMLFRHYGGGTVFKLTPPAATILVDCTDLHPVAGVLYWI